MPRRTCATEYRSAAAHHYNDAAMIAPRAATCRLLPLLLLAACLLGGCSSFERQWSQLAEADAAQTGITGPWQGKWISAASDHEGALRCIVSPLPVTDAAAALPYLFSFSATWGPGIISEYEIVMEVQPGENGRRPFAGAMELNFLFIHLGTYRCEGVIEGDQFQATYEAEDDRGTFEMTRPAQ